MIIKSVTIVNYLCYYDIKEFLLTPGLNIILGENGEGKTKFFEAIEWLFNGENSNLDLLVSAKALHEAEIDQQFPVRVSIKFEQELFTYFVTKSFLVRKVGEGICKTSNFSIEGIEENRIGERSPVDGRVLIERIFPITLRRYSMFKGEAELDIFKNEEALINLINTFSSAKFYDKYSNKGEFLRDKAEKAVDDATKSNSKSLQEYRKIEAEIQRLLTDRNKITIFINSLEDQINKTEINIQEADKYVSNAEALKIVNERIENIASRIRDVESYIDEDYTIALFDKLWILMHFEPLHIEYFNKVAILEEKKRQLQSEFDIEIGIKKGRKKLKADLLNNAIPLPSGVPSKAHMEEMLNEELCKVCNRPALKGSEAYNFMVNRLEEYLKLQEPELVEEDNAIPILFSNDYTRRLFSMGVQHEDSLVKIRGIKRNIKELFDFNKKRRKELESLTSKHEHELSEREKVIGQSSIGADKLDNVLKNYNSWQKDLINYNKDLHYNKNRLKVIDDDLTRKKTEKDRIDIKTANTFLLKTREILRDIETVFIETKEAKFNQFVESLETESNNNFSQMNKGSFTGQISMIKEISAGKPVVKVTLIQYNGQPIHKPGTALNTSKHISILFAISRLTLETKTESYPIILDAPTSTYGETKLNQFYENIYGNFEQAIILTKDFIKSNRNTSENGINNDELYLSPEFNSIKKDNAIWVKLQRPFNEKKLDTLNTQIINL